jgi:predicted TIM-barrel fold metal-dependent hydrolase
MQEDPFLFIDAHHHLWDLQACHYPWLMAQGVERFFGDPSLIQKNYLPADFLSESSQYQPTKSVHIQVGVSEEDEVRETQWLQQLGKVPAAIVAAADLANPSLSSRLEAHQACNKLRGIRQIIGRHAIEDKNHGSDALLEDKGFRRGLELLIEKRLSFDLQMIPPQMSRVITLLRELPELRVALCHCGSPWDQSAEGLESWRRGLAAIAELPNVYCKISGLGMFNRNWAPRDLEPVILSVIDIFGPERTMFGSNFPVDKLYNCYEALWRTYEDTTQRFTQQERTQMFVSTAEDFYNI